MTTPAWVLLALAAVAAVADWWALVVGSDRWEQRAKPAVPLLLIGVAVALDPAQPAVRVWFVIALVGGLAGDVLLMWDRFVPGAAAFLLGHLAYLGGLLLLPRRWAGVVIGLLALAVLLATAGRRIVAGARTQGRTLAVVVAVYQVVLGAVAVLALGSPGWLVGAGAVLFVASDTLLGWTRFVGRPAPGGRVAVHVTYHLAQVLLVASLVVGAG